VVGSNLQPGMITIHMLMALAIVGVLLFAWFRASREIVFGQSLADIDPRFAVWLHVALGCTVLQVILGVQVREMTDFISRAQGEAMRSSWIQAMPWFFYVHRSFSALVFAVNAWLLYLLSRSLGWRNLLTRCTAFVLAAVAAAIASGATLGHLGMPAFVQPAHLLAAALLFGLQLLLWLAYRQGRLAISARAKPAHAPIKDASHVPAGMPALDLGGRATSFFEFWPSWLIYAPVAALWLLLAARYRSLSLPLLTNPALPLSAMAGVPKSSILQRAGESARESILPWIVFAVGDDSPAAQRERAEAAMAAAGLRFPLVGKPDIGCRGAGVKLLRDSAALESCLASFPPGSSLLLQRLGDWEAEAGIFYVRDPASGRGKITSLALKYTPYVVGDGVRSLAELVAADPRAGGLAHLYEQRNSRHWHEVTPRGVPFRLVFSASHCRGAIFRDGRALATAQLAEALERFFDDLPGFHYGRLDVKFRDIESLRAGRDLQIIEINGASSEPLHIWDRQTRFPAAMQALLQQYRTLFTLGNEQRKRGCKPPGLCALYRAWRLESRLVKRYPAND